MPSIKATILVEELKKDHNLILEKLDKAKQLGITSPEGQKELMSVKTLLLAHLKKEDRDFYPVLKEAAAKDSWLQKTISLFAEDMGEISSQAISFFERHSQQRLPEEFAKDSGKLLAVLKTRIQREESILYKEFEKIG